MHECVLSHFSCVRLFVTPWTVAHQIPLFLGFSRQEYWSEWPCPPPGDLPKPGIEPSSLASSMAGGFFPTGATWDVSEGSFTFSLWVLHGIFFIASHLNLYSLTMKNQLPKLYFSLEIDLFPKSEILQKSNAFQNDWSRFFYDSLCLGSISFSEARVFSITVVGLSLLTSLAQSHSGNIHE